MLPRVRGARARNNPLRARLGRAFFDADHVDPRTQTRKLDVAPCVMLVALADGEAELCATALKSLASKPLAVTRVAHIRAACERMLKAHLR